MSIFSVIYIVLAVLLLFGAAIFFHELGHYWVALKLGYAEVTDQPAIGSAGRSE